MGKGGNTKRQKVEIEKPKSLQTAICVNSKLPPHVIQVIFSKLSIVNLPCCRIVCKAWNDMVLNYYSSSSSTFKFLSNPILIASKGREKLFSKERLYRIVFHIDFDPKQQHEMKFIASFQLPYHLLSVKFVNSCNGLLCMSMKEMCETGFCCILNPMTNEYVELPIYKPKDSCFYTYGLGFSFKTKQYKTIRLMFDLRKKDKVRAVDVLTLGCNIEWRPVNFTGIYMLTQMSDGVYLNEALYWVGRSRGEIKNLWRFDVEHENFEAVSLPKIGSINHYSVYIQVFDGRLYVNLCDKRKRIEIEIWTMQLGHEREETWTKKFVVKNLLQDLLLDWVWEMPLQLIKIYEDGEILFFVQFEGLASYDIKDGRITKITQSEECYFDSFYQIQYPNFDSLKKMVAGDR